MTKTLEKQDHQKLLPVKVPSPNNALVLIDPLQQYMAEVRKYKLLTSDEQRNLAIRFKEDNDTEAGRLLVASNLRLVIKIAMEFQRGWMQNLQDLIQEGNLGLMRAAVKFDPYRGVKFSYYAAFWIKAYVLKFIMDNLRLVKVGTTGAQRKLFFNLNKEKQKLINNGFSPDTKLLSQKMGVSEKNVIEMEQRLNYRDASLDAPIKEDAYTEMINFIPAKSQSPEEQTASKEIKTLLHEKINKFKTTITDRELEIFEKRTFTEDPVTLESLGRRYGISRERVRQVEKGIINKIKIFFDHEIPDFQILSQHEKKSYMTKA